MLDLAREILGTQPILTAFLAIGVGYLVGQINFGSFSLGVGAVLFVGLAIGAFAPKAQITGPIGLTGLIMFLYGIGILYGRQFFEGMRGIGLAYNALALVACIAGLVVALALGRTFGIKVGHVLGMYAGSMTSTATLQAALDVMKSKDPSIGYSIAYPFGVIGPILCIYFMSRLVKPSFPPKAQRFHMGEISIGETFAGRTLDDITRDLPSGVQVTMVRHAGRNVVPTAATAIASGDAVLVVADRRKPSRTPPRCSAASSLDGWRRIAPTSTTSACSSARPMSSAFRLKRFNCRPSGTSCTCAATTPICCPQRISCSSSAIASAC